MDKFAKSHTGWYNLAKNLLLSGRLLVLPILIQKRATSTCNLIDSCNLWSHMMRLYFVCPCTHFQDTPSWTWPSNCCCEVSQPLLSHCIPKTYFPMICVCLVFYLHSLVMGSIYPPLYFHVSMRTAFAFIHLFLYSCISFSPSHQHCSHYKFLN